MYKCVLETVGSWCMFLLRLKNVFIFWSDEEHVTHEHRQILFHWKVTGLFVLDPLPEEIPVSVNTSAWTLLTRHPTLKQRQEKQWRHIFCYSSVILFISEGLSSDFRYLFFTTELFSYSWFPLPGLCILTWFQCQVLFRFLTDLWKMLEEFLKSCLLYWMGSLF